MLANVLLTAVSLTALAYWIFALTPAGEAQPLSASNEEEWIETEEMNEQLQKLSDSITLTPRGLSSRNSKKRR